MDAEGWVHTGDLGSMDGRGVITLTGRLKDMIIRGGENIAPAEIESHLVAHEAVQEAAVVGVPDERWGETVAAVVRVRPGHEAGPREALTEHCRDRLAPFKVPARQLVPCRERSSPPSANNGALHGRRATGHGGTFAA